MDDPDPLGDDPDPKAVNKRMMELVTPIAIELRERLGSDLDQRDLDAITSAVLKAAGVGLDLGTTETTAQVIEQGADVTFNSGSLNEYLAGADIWAKKYGSEDA